MHRQLPLIIFPLLKLVVHLASYRGYGMFRDEFYYLACSHHLAWGYVDQPPLSIFVLWVTRLLLGDSLFAVRLVPALAGAATVLVAGLITRRLGGGKGAQSLAMVAVIAAPVYLSLNHFYSMNALDILVWALAAYLLVNLLQRNDPRLWILLGTVLGIGLMNKISVLWLGFGLAVGLLATDRRRLLLTRGPWITGGIAAAFLAPYLLWQMKNDWPTVEFIRNATQNKMVAVAPLAFLEGQITTMNAVAFPLWITGLGWLLFARAGRPFRLLGIVYLAVFALLVANGTSRSGYLSPAYTWLLPAGAVAAERWLSRWRAVPLWSYAALIAIGGVLFAPFALPVLPVERYISYAARAGVGPSTAERKELAELPQFYADMHGWEAIVETVAGVYHSLPLGDREKAAIFTFNYGDAGAIDYLGRAHGLPKAIGGHNNYWLWGPRNYTGEVVLVMGEERKDVEQSFEHVELGAVIDCGRCMPYENGRSIWIARGLRGTLTERWAQLKHYN